MTATAFRYRSTVTMFVLVTYVTTFSLMSNVTRNVAPKVAQNVACYVALCEPLLSLFSYLHVTVSL